LARRITDECISCGLCVDECPNDAIYCENEVYGVRFEDCTECVGFYDAPHCSEVCPVDCIEPDPDHSETPEELMEKAVRLHPERFPRD
jgi:ferredoxin